MTKVLESFASRYSLIYKTGCVCINGTTVSDSQHSVPAHGSGRVFHCSLLFHTGLCGNCVIYIHSEGRNGLDTIGAHYIFILAETLVSCSRPIGLFDTDIYLSKYVSGYLKGKKKKEKKTPVFIKSLIVS